MLDASYRAKIRWLIHDMAYDKNAIKIHHNLPPRQIQQDEGDAKATIGVINENFISPFG